MSEAEQYWRVLDRMCRERDALEAENARLKEMVADLQLKYATAMTALAAALKAPDNGGFPLAE